MVMLVDVRNVRDAYYWGMRYLRTHGIEEATRAGPAIVAPGPVLTTYARPTERVILDTKRDANPLFHLFESLWMLAGRDDGRWLDLFVKDYSSRFGEPADGRIHGAYGHRWRRFFGLDQLDTVVAKLRANPGDRQAVIQMWDATPGHVHVRLVPATNYDRSRNGPISEWVGLADLTGNWRDRPCNTHAYLRIRDGEYSVVSGEYSRVLDLTVCCRSNDAIWGAYGANAVHFSVLLEYLAGRIGVGVGQMYQFSNNFHAYRDAFDKVYPTEDLSADDEYGPTHLIVGDPASFDEDLRDFMRWTDGDDDAVLGSAPPDYPRNPWLVDTAQPLYCAARLWRSGEREQARRDVVGDHDVFPNIAPDWRRAVLEWMDRRIK